MSTSTEGIIRHGLINVARNRALTILARNHPEEFARITRQVRAELGIREAMERPCACGGVIRMAGRGRWPSACRECKEKKEASLDGRIMGSHDPQGRQAA